MKNYSITFIFDNDKYGGFFIMSVKSIFCAFVFVFMTASVFGATVEFRSGTVLAADFTVKQPDVKLEDSNVPNRIFARMVIKLPLERKLSIFDYQLSAYGRKFKAVAVSVDNGKWLTDGETVESMNSKTRVSLLFEVDGSVIGKRDIEVFEVVAVADPDAKKKDIIKFKSLKNGTFSRVSSIPESGNMVK